MTELEFFKRIAFREYPGTMAILIVNELVGAALLLIGIGTFVPFLAGLLGGSAAPPGPLADLFAWLGVLTWAPAEVLALLIVMVALRILLDAARKYIASIIGISFERDVKKRMIDAVAGSDWERVLNADHGKYVQCMVSESLQARRGVTSLAAAFGAGFLTLLLLGWLALYSVETFALLVLSSVLFLLTNRRLLRLIGEYAKRRIGLTARMNTRVTDTRHVFKVLFAEGLTGAMANAIARFIDAVAAVERRSALISVIVQHYVLMYGVAVVAAVSMVHLLHYGTAGSTLLFDLILIQRIATYFGEFQMKRGGLANTIPSYAACLEMMDTHRAPKGESRGTGAALALKQGIVVERVSFSFAGRGPVLENVNFDLPAAGLVFFAGPSGSGKTTMVDILLGLLRPKEGGRVLIDGEELGRLDETRWRRSVAYVPQDAYILSGTLRDYLSFGAGRGRRSTDLGGPGTRRGRRVRARPAGRAGHGGAAGGGRFFRRRTSTPVHSPRPDPECQAPHSRRTILGTRHQDRASALPIPPRSLCGHAHRGRDPFHGGNPRHGPHVPIFPWQGLPT